MEAKTIISDIQGEHSEWLKNLKFTKDELSTFDRQLGDVIKKNNVPETARHVEHFQNQFIRQKEVIDELRHEIKQYENNLSIHSEASRVANESAFENLRFNLVDQMETFEKIYSELKEEFQNFLSRTS